MTGPMGPLLVIENLSITYLEADGRAAPAVTGTSLCLEAGEVVGLLGESGSGKSSLCRAVVRAIPPARCRIDGQIILHGRDLTRMPIEQLRPFAASEVGFVAQESATALHPALKVSDQVAEVARAKMRCGTREAQIAARDALEAVGLGGDAGRLLTSYPHQLSGGQKQRVLVAQAIVGHPRLLLVDEPTASLDALTTLKIVQLLRQVRKTTGVAMLVVSHDPQVLGALADRIAVMYAGRIVEIGSTKQILSTPSHPYTAALLHCGRRAHSQKRHLRTITGEPESTAAGCCFEPRCAERVAACSQTSPELLPLAQDSQVRCLVRIGSAG